MLLFSCTVLIRKDKIDNPVELNKISKIKKQFYADSVKYHYKGRVFSVPIMFDDNTKPTSVLGTCYFGVIRHITFNKKNWQYLSLIQQKMVMYHELGHCILNRRHQEDKLTKNQMLNLLPDGCPTSVMVEFLPKT